jgi:hypothetical protein
MTTPKAHRTKKTGLGAEAWFAPSALPEATNVTEPQASLAAPQSTRTEEEPQGDGKIRRTLALTPHAYLLLERMKLHLLETAGKKATLGELVEEAVLDLARKLGVRSGSSMQ